MAQCSSCQFNNMPGATHCGRCGTSLQLATAAIDVHPPRASRLALAWRRSVFGALYLRLSSRWNWLAAELPVDPNASLPSLAVLVRTVIPGWAQIYSGREILGTVLMASFGTFLLLTGLFYGTAVGTLLLGLLLTIHGISLYDMAAQSTSLRTDRLIRCFVYSFVMVTCVYLPVGFLVTRIAEPIRILVDWSPLERGDVLFSCRDIYRWRRPTIGDIVVYEVPSVTISGHGAVLVIRGQRIERIVGVGGQAILWENGHLQVNGITAGQKPLGTNTPVTRMEFVVPKDHVLILPGTEVMRRPFPIDEKSLKTWCVVPVENIRGLVYWRHSPFSRMGPVR